MKKYKKCPYCRAKNDVENVICTNCNRVFNTKANTKFLIKRVITVIIFLVCFAGGYFATNAIIKNISKKKPETTNKREHQSDEIGFLEISNKIKYSSDYQENKLIPVKSSSGGDNKYNLIDKDGNAKYKEFSKYVEDYNTFHIIAKYIDNDNVYYIVDNEGNELYSSLEKIRYFPLTNSWLIGTKLYNNNKLINDSIVITEDNYYDGYYFSFNNKENAGIVNYSGNITYNAGIKNYFILETSDISKDEDKNYCLINDEYQYKIINCDTGEKVFEKENSKITQIKANVFKAEGTTFYINKEGKVVHDTESAVTEDINVEYLMNKYLILGNSLYNRSTYNFSQFSPEGLSSYDDADIEKSFNVHKLYCKKNVAIYYGLEYGFDTIVSCNQDSIFYPSYSIMSYLSKKNNLYAFIKNGKRTTLYDIRNNKKVMVGVTSESLNSIFITYKENDNRFVYNLYDNTKLEYGEGVLVELYSNYFVFEKIDPTTRSIKKEYYNKDFTKIYTGI